MCSFTLHNNNIMHNTIVRSILPLHSFHRLTALLNPKKAWKLKLFKLFWSFFLIMWTMVQYISQNCEPTMQATCKMLNEGNPVDYQYDPSTAAPEPTHVHVPWLLQPLIPIHSNNHRPLHNRLNRPSKTTTSPWALARRVRLTKILLTLACDLIRAPKHSYAKWHFSIYLDLSLS